MSTSIRSESTTGDVSLLEFLDLSQLTCLNEDLNHTLKSILQQKNRNTASDNYLLSDADEQLLLHIPFNQSVRVRSIIIHGSVKDQAPSVLKIMANRMNVGFEDIEDAKEPEVSQILDLKEEEVTKGLSVALRYVRFQSVNSLHIFVGSNHGGTDITRIDSIDIFGVPVETTKDLSGLKKTEAGM